MFGCSMPHELQTCFRRAPQDVLLFSEVWPCCDPKGLTAISTCEYVHCKHCVYDTDCCVPGQICCKWGCGKRCVFPYEYLFG